MDPNRFDHLTRRLATRSGPLGAGTPSRRRVLQAVGGVLAAAALPALAPSLTAAKGAKKKCKKKGGSWLATADGTSPCHCAVTCSSTVVPSCEGQVNCACAETAEGAGFCASGNTPVAFGCASTSDCPAGATCVIFPESVHGCGANNCTSNSECQFNNGITYACLNGTCRATYCVHTCGPCQPQCHGKSCGDDGCGGSCGSCPDPTCQGGVLTTSVCEGGVCALARRLCGAGQVCYQNACCTKQPEPSCRAADLSDGCGGTYPANCSLNCCEDTHGKLVCQAGPCT